jgi:hypothetical protein
MPGEIPMLIKPPSASSLFNWSALCVATVEIRSKCSDLDKGVYIMEVAFECLCIGVIVKSLSEEIDVSDAECPGRSNMLDLDELFNSSV